MNNKPFGHTSRYGTIVTSDRCDFANGITIIKDHNLSEDRYISDIAEAFGFHAANILPNLNGFQGYDCLKFNFI
jgi:hypothetical protein